MKKLHCRKCGAVIDGTTAKEIDINFEGSQVGQKTDGTGILDPMTHKDCGGSLYEKIILLDAVDAFVSKEGKIFEEMHKLLEAFPNKKILLTGANDEQMKEFGLDNMPYPVFTLKHEPEKTNPEYFRKMLEHFGLPAEEVVYFEHKPEAAESAQSVGITTYYYDPEKKDLKALGDFLSENL